MQASGWPPREVRVAEGQPVEDRLVEIVQGKEGTSRRPQLGGTAVSFQFNSHPLYKRPLKLSLSLC